MFHAHDSKTDPGRWLLLGASITGASHLRKENNPNQDSFRFYRKTFTSWMHIAAVADGHGGLPHFRSNEGSRLAVDVLVGHLKKVANALDNIDGSVRIRDEMFQSLPVAIQKSWRKAVAEHHAQNPMNRDVYRLLCGIDNKTGISKVFDDIAYAYGSTLLGTLITKSFIVFIQLGDGNILTIDQDGKVKEVFDSTEEDLLMNRTHSLCSEDMTDHCKIRCVNRSENDPVLICISTDGYRNSFKSKGGFLQTGPDYLELLRNEGAEYVQEEMSSYLRAASDDGSGDDVTLVLLYRESEIKKKDPGFLSVLHRSISLKDRFL